MSFSKEDKIRYEQQDKNYQGEQNYEQKTKNPYHGYHGTLALPAPVYAETIEAKQSEHPAVKTFNASIDTDLDAPAATDYTSDERNNISAAAEDIADTLSDFNTSVDLSAYNLTKDEANNTISVMLDTHPEIFYVEDADAEIDTDTGYVHKMHFALRPDARTEEKQLEEKTREILADIGPNWSDIQKLLYLHNWLCDNVTYRDVNEVVGPNYDISLTSYAAIVLGAAVCDGYANAYTYLGRLCGLDVNIVEGMTGSGSHAWNSVNLNGNKYFIDVTWDDGDSQVAPSCINFLNSRDKCSQIHSNGDYSDWQEVHAGFSIPISECQSCNDKTYDNYPEYSDIASFIFHDDSFLTFPHYSQYIYKWQNNYREPFIAMPANEICESIIEYNGYIFTYVYNKIYQYNPESSSWDTILEINDRPISIEELTIINGTLQYKQHFDENGNYSDNWYYYTVNTNTVPTSNPTLNKTNILFEGTGKSEQLFASNASNVIWSSNNPSVATVDQNGLVTSTGYGRAYITAEENGKKARCLIMVDTTWQSDYRFNIDRSDYPGTFTINEYLGNASDITLSEPVYYLGQKVKTHIQPGYSICTNGIWEDYNFLTGTNASNDTLKNFIFDGKDGYLELNPDCQWLFNGCNSLETVTIANTNSVKNISYMFAYCPSLKTIDLRTMDLSNIESQDNVAYVFGYDKNACKYLTTIYTPINLRYTIELFDKFKDEQGNIYTTLPTNRSDSIKLTKIGSTDKPTPTPEPTPTQTPDPDPGKPEDLESNFTLNNINYTLLENYSKTDSNGFIGEVSVTSTKGKPSTITIPDYVEYKGYKLKVTQIGSGAFKGCEKLANLYIYSELLCHKFVGANAFKDIKEKCNVYVPSSVKNDYSQWLKKKGQKKIKIKAI